MKRVLGARFLNLLCGEPVARNRFKKARELLGTWLIAQRAAGGSKILTGLSSSEWCPCSITHVCGESGSEKSGFCRFRFVGGGILLVGNILGEIVGLSVGYIVLEMMGISGKVSGNTIVKAAANRTNFISSLTGLL